jgi:hypothetical protein
LPLCCCEWPAIVQWDTVPSTHEINFNHILDLHLPYGMKLIFQTFGLCMFGHKCLDHIQFLNATSFKTTRIMKAEIWSTLEYHLILNIMLSTLKKFSCYQGLMKALTSREGERTDRSICKEEYLSMSSLLFDYFALALLPFESRISGSSVVSQIRLSIVDLPAFALPIIRIRNLRHFSLSSSLRGSLTSLSISRVGEINDGELALRPTGMRHRSPNLNEMPSISEIGETPVTGIRER